MGSMFSEVSLVESWLQTEAALARAQANSGIISRDEAEAITSAAVLENIELDRLWSESRNVGYPILPLVRMIAAALPDGPNGRVHYGATTQDIMDTGLSLQLRAALDRFHELLDDLGDHLTRLVNEHRHTVMAARTHAQQAVPTTFGAKIAALLDEFRRHWERLLQARSRICVVSLFGAGGTSAAMGAAAADVRDAMARDLGLAEAVIPWHVARDGLAEFGHLCALLAGTCARFGREVIDLSRTEIGEVGEPAGHHRGASSTMPQKVNPIGSEGVVGMSAAAGALASSLYRAMEAGHERAAGEWQAEWFAIPQLATLGAGTLHAAGAVAAGLRVFPDVMRANLDADGGLIMAEAYMMRLAPRLGRERAHDVVYTAVQRVREDGRGLQDSLGEHALSNQLLLDADDYVGEPDLVCDAALSRWATRTPLQETQR